MFPLSLDWKAKGSKVGEFLVHEVRSSGRVHSTLGECGISRTPIADLKFYGRKRRTTDVLVELQSEVFHRCSIIGNSVRSVTQFPKYTCRVTGFHIPGNSGGKMSSSLTPCPSN